MRKLMLGLALTLFLGITGCRSIYSSVWKVPEWVGGKVLNVYTGNGHYDGGARWDHFARNWQQIWNVVDIHFFNYDIKDPYLGAPFFGDPN